MQPASYPRPRPGLSDPLSIELADPRKKPSADSHEIPEGVVLDYDAEGRLVGIDIVGASNKTDRKRLVLNKLPAEIERPAA